MANTYSATDDLNVTEKFSRRQDMVTHAINVAASGTVATYTYRENGVNITSSIIAAAAPHIAMASRWDDCDY